jgi:hypothetical protein
MPKKHNAHGEGNYEAARKYNEGLRNFIRSGRVGRAARAAEPASEVEALQMAAAETEGRRRAKEEDAALRRAMPKPPVPTKPADAQERDTEYARYVALMLGVDPFD